MFLWWGLTGVLLYVAAKQHMEQIPLQWYREKQIQEEIRILGEYRTYLQTGTSTRFRIKEFGNKLFIYMKIGRKWYTFLYEPQSKLLRYDKHYQQHPLLLKMGILQTNQILRNIGDSYLLQKKRNDNEASYLHPKWKLLFTTYDTNFELVHWSQNELFVKKIYTWEDMRLIHFQYEDGSQRFLCMEGTELEVECTYDARTGRCYMTEKTIEKELFQDMQEELVSFCESFCEREREGLHDVKIEQQVMRDIKRWKEKGKHHHFEKEWEELWGYYQNIAEETRIQHIPEIKEAVSHLMQKREQQQLIVKEQNDEN